MQLNNLLERKLYLLVAVILAIFYSTIDLDSFGFNKTVGMAYTYDAGIISKAICVVSLLLSFIGYSILSLLKYKTQKVLSLVYLSDIVPAIILSYTKTPEVSIVFGVMSIVVSFINIISSLKSKAKN